MIEKPLAPGEYLPLTLAPTKSRRCVGKHMRETALTGPYL
jgi:hypothetical protein